MAALQDRYKKGIDASANANRRTQTTISIRKAKKNELMSRRRKVDHDSKVSAVPLVISQEVIATLDGPQHYYALQHIRKSLSKNSEPPIAQLLAIPNIVDKMIHFLQDVAHPMVQFEAAWIITNIAAGKSHETAMLLPHIGAIFQVMRTCSVHVRDQLVWTIGNIVGESPECREFICRQGGVELLLYCYQNCADADARETTVWSVSNLCKLRGLSNESRQKIVTHILPLLHESIQDNKLTDSAKSDAMWGISYLASTVTSDIVARGMIEPMVKLLDSHSIPLKVAVVRTLGTIATGNDIQTQCVVESGFVQHAIQILMHNHTSQLRKECCWAISNIAAGTTAQVQVLLNYNFPKCIVELMKTARFEVRREATWILTNMLAGGTPAQSHSIMLTNALDALVSMLDVQDTTLLITLLDSFDKIFRESDDYVSTFESLGGWEALQKLEAHPHQSIFEKVELLQTRFYNVNEDDEEERHVKFDFSTN